MKNHIKYINRYREGRTREALLQKKLLYESIRAMSPSQPCPSLIFKRHNSVSLDFMKNKLVNSPFKRYINMNIVKFMSTKALSISKQTVYFEYSPIYAYIKSILDDKSKTSFDKQMDIEKFMLNTWLDIVECKKVDMVNNKVTSESFKLINEYMREYIKSLTHALQDLKERGLKLKDYELYTFLYDMKIIDIAATVLNKVIPIISNPEGVKYNDFIINLGGLIHRLWLSVEYEEYKKSMKGKSTRTKKTVDKNDCDAVVKIISFKEFIKDREISIQHKGLIGNSLPITYWF